MKLTRLFFLTTVKVLFILIWGINLLISSPDNLIKHELDPIVVKLDCFSQNWSFFAPPQKYNVRLYYTFYDKNHKFLKEVEVLKKMTKLKSDGAPFNSRLQAFDYSLHGPIIEIYSIISKSEYNMKHTSMDSIPIKRYESLKSYYSINVLKNYSKILLNQIDSKNIEYFKITLTQIPIKKIKSKKLKDIESILLKSDYVKVN
jgi:hypothetical protein